MCGICGVVALDGPLDPSVRSTIDAMTDRLAHRGPDGRGVEARSLAALGHRRLAIIDRAGGAQPMANEDETCWIVFNGEIYNHRELRPVLEARGHRFRTVSDTETILHAYEEYGPAAVERLEGMFAFAIWDEPRRRLFAARDRLGKKPFFYAEFGGALHFASEMGALRASAAWPGTIDLDALETYLALGYFLAPATAWRGVRKLLPGHWLTLTDGRLEVRQYWDVTEFDTDRRDGEALLTGIDQTLGGAVTSRLESEVPLGAFLSGGIDSGLVVSYMAEGGASPLITTSVGFADEAHNELEAAALTARHFATEHHAHQVEPRLDEVFGPAVANVGEPLADSSAIPTWYVSRAARQHVTVALSGDGGDETFAGYDFRYVPHAREERLRRVLAGVPGRRALGWLARHWTASPRAPRALRWKNVFSNLAGDAASAYYLDLCFLRPWAVARLLGRSPDADPTESPAYAQVTEPYRRCPSGSVVQRAEYADLKVYMPNDPLVKVDRMSMAHGLEVRSPFLDRHVVELAFRVPAGLKQQGSTGKALLRALAARRLPAGLSALPKRGFTVPIGAWIAGPYRARYRDEVLSPGARIGSWLDRRHLTTLVDDHQAGRADHTYTLWAVWVLERWLRAAEET